MKTLLHARCTIIALCFLTGCHTNKSANVTGQREFAAPTAQRPAVLYVTDFTLPAEIIQHEEGALSGRSGPAGRVGDRLSGASTDTETRAQKLVDLMSRSLIKDLSKAGFNAVRLPPDAPLPAQGWLVRGCFTAVQEGNRVRRSMIGMGEGKTDLQVLSCVNDLSLGPPRPLYEIATDANSGSQVGAAPTLALGPYGVAVHFVKSGTDLEKNVKQTASQIAAQIVQHVQQTGSASHP
jgi:uncharacterized protein DUF4410